MQETQNKQESGDQRRSIRNSNAACVRAELARYAACVFEPADVVEVRRLPSGQSSWYWAGKLAEAAESLLYNNQHGQHIYVGANPRRAQGGTTSKDVSCARCLFVDLDGIDPDTARNRWRTAGLPMPTLTISSGHGVHAYWRLAKPVTDLSQWSALQKKLIALLDSDSAIHDPARIMRLPGFRNHKEPVAECQIIDDEHTRRFDIKSLMSLLYSAITESDYMAQYLAANNNTTQSKKPFPDNISAVKIAKLAAAKWLGVTKGGRNCKAFQNAAYLIKNLALTKDQAWPILQQWNLKNRPPLLEGELRQAMRNASIYGRHPVGLKIVQRF